MDNQKRIEDIIAMLDGCVNDGVGHINLEINNSDEGTENMKIETFKSNDCSKGNQACAVPTLQTSVDGE